MTNKIILVLCFIKFCNSKTVLSDVTQNSNSTDDSKHVSLPATLHLPGSLSSSSPTHLRAVKYPCQCEKSICNCCTGNLMQNFNINIRQKGCVKLAYNPDDFSIDMGILYNDRLLYNTQLSGKNPPPVCLPIPFGRKTGLCVKLSNVYFIGRNFHACIGMEVQFNDNTVFQNNFDCVRLGVDGVAIVKPEEGGGLPHPSQPQEEIEDYDEVIGEVAGQDEENET